MANCNKKSENNLRRQRNRDMVKRMRSGDALTLYDSKDSWYPPRPIIRKDLEVAQKLHAANGNTRDRRPKQPPSLDTSLKVIGGDSYARLTGQTDAKVQHHEAKSNIISLQDLASRNPADSKSTKR